MRILMIGPYKPQVGGGSHAVQNLSKQLSKEHKIIVINMEERGLPVGLGHWKDGKIDVYQEKMIFPYRYTTIQTIIQTTKRALLLRKNIDLYHTHGVACSGIGFIDHKKPLVMTIHGYFSLGAVRIGRIKTNSLQFKFMRYIEKKTAERADAIIAVGKTLRQWIIKELGTDSQKVFYVPDGIDPDVFRKIPPDKNPIYKKLKNEKPILIFTKHFSPIYGPQDLIIAFKQILKEYPKAKLIMLGEDKYRKNIVNISKSLGIQNNIIFPGRVENTKVPYYLSIANIFINPTRVNETFGISLIEAMACERPVVATAVGGPKEILEEGLKQMGEPVGLLAPPKDPNALAEAILYLLEHPEEAREMGKRAREYALKNYTWDIVTKKTLEVYKYAMKNHKNRD